MGRPRSITEEEVLAAARAVFLKKGIAGTTADVARRCGVSEATVFRRFPTKNDLFRAAMVRDGLPGWVGTLHDRAGDADIRAALMAVATEALRYYRRMLPLWMMIMSNPTITEQEYQRRFRFAATALLEEFFAAAIRAGRVKNHPPKALAVIFAGTIASFAMIEMNGSIGLADSVLLEALVDSICEPDRGSRR